MTFFCHSCEQNRDFDRDYGVMVIDFKKVMRRYCRLCQSPKAAVPDVYFDGKPEINLADDPTTGKPRVFSSRGEKAAYLKERGICEAGDKVRGAPVMLHKEKPPKLDSRHEVQMALKRVKEMGRDVRRQEYLKIQKEGRRYA